MGKPDLKLVADSANILNPDCPFCQQQPGCEFMGYTLETHEFNFDLYRCDEPHRLKAVLHGRRELTGVLVLRMNIQGYVDEPPCLNIERFEQTREQAASRCLDKASVLLGAVERPCAPSRVESVSPRLTYGSFLVFGDIHGKPIKVSSAPLVHLAYKKI